MNGQPTPGLGPPARDDVNACDYIVVEVVVGTNNRARIELSLGHPCSSAGGMD